MRKTDNSTHQTIMYFRLLCSKRRIQFPPISPSVITMSKSERFENMQGRILPNFDESTSRILVDDELKALVDIQSGYKRDSFGRIEKLGVPVVKSAAANERDVASVLAGNHSVQSVAHYRDGKVQI